MSERKTRRVTRVLAGLLVAILTPTIARAQSEILVEHEHPVAGRVRQTRTPARFEGTPPGAPRGAPRLGEHSAEILAELGYSESEVARLRESGALGREDAAAITASSA